MVPVVGYYTIGTPYEKESELMEQSAYQFGVEKVYLKGIPDKGKWELNCGQKPEILLAFAHMLKRPFLYVDVDARFKRYPDILDLDWSHYGIGVHFFKGKELLSGTIWINPTPQILGLLELWKQECDLHPGQWDQKVLQRILTAEYPVFKLPPEYAFIYDLSRRYYGKDINPVIEHYQASRKYRRRQS
jgi:hypothetical protein